MNLRCIYCQTPFTLSRVEMLNGIIAMNERHQNHYDAHCPRCRRANSISRQRMELFFPNWQAAAKELASAPTPAPEPKAEVPAAALAKTEPLPKPAVAKKAKKPAEKKSAEKRTTVAKKPATATASKAKKPVAKTTESKPKKK